MSGPAEAPPQSSPKRAQTLGVSRPASMSASRAQKLELAYLAQVRLTPSSERTLAQSGFLSPPHYLSRSSSSRSSSKRFKTQCFEVPNPLAISTVEYPCEAEVATVRRIACPRTESVVQSGIECNEARSRPLVGAAGELPTGAVVRALPVDRAALGCAVEEAAEAASPWIEGLGEFPSDFEQPGDEVVSLVGSEAGCETATADRPDK